MSAPTSVHVSLATIDPTWGHALRVWWSWQWRTIVFGLILSVITMPIGMVAGIVFGQSRVGHIVAQLMGFLTFAFVGIFVMKDILDKEFNGFRVAILPKSENL